MSTKVANAWVRAPGGSFLPVWIIFSPPLAGAAYMSMTVAGVWLLACQALLQEQVPSRLAAAPQAQLRTWH